MFSKTYFWYVSKLVRLSSTSFFALAVLVLCISLSLSRRIMRSTSNLPSSTMPRMRLTISAIPPNCSDGPARGLEVLADELYIACRAAKLIGAIVGLTSARGDAVCWEGVRGPAVKLAALRALGDGRICHTSLNCPAMESSSAVRESTRACSDLAVAPDVDELASAACAACKLAERESFRKDKSESCSDRFCVPLSALGN